MAQSWNADFYGRTSRYVSDLGAPLIALLEPQAGERVLDLGCGDGALTARLIAAGCDVVGVDSSQSMVAAARQRGIDARWGDARKLDFRDEFDAAFTNAALHWVKDAFAAAQSVRRALKAGGRFVGEFGGDGNVEAVRGAIRQVLEARGLDFERLNPWYFPTTEQYRETLTAAGFQVERIELFDRPTPIPGDAAEWLANFGGAFFAPLPLGERIAAVQQAQELAKPLLQGPDGRWTIDYVRLRFRAHAV